MKTNPLATDSLAFILLRTAFVLTDVMKGVSLTTALPRHISISYPANTRGAIQDISYRTLRQYGLAKTLITQLITQKPSLLLECLLSSCLTLLIEKCYPDYTIVDQAVQAANAQSRLTRARSLVNAVLRRFLREQTFLLDRARQHDEAHWNYPDWWINKVRHHYPDQWQEILKCANQPAPLTLRVNQRQKNTQQYLQQLQQFNMPAQLIGPTAICLKQPMPVTQIPGFSQGEASVQDMGAQLAAPLLELQDGMHVLDACAAPGGKTGHMLELAQLDLIALDQDPLRLKRIEENLNRLKVQAQICHGDARHPDKWWNGRLFDRILADVPCSASGIVRRHPDIRWLRRPEDLLSLPQQQYQILSALWPLLAHNGKLLYATCSIFPEEGEAVIQKFLQQKNDAFRLYAPGQLIPDCTDGNIHDGFFYALLQKK